MVYLCASILKYCWFFKTDFGPWTILGLFKFDVGVYTIWFKYSWLLIMWYDYKIILWQKGLNDKQNINGIFLLIHDLLYCVVQAFCIWLYKTDFIMAAVAEMSNVVHEPLICLFLRVFVLFWFGLCLFVCFLLFCTLRQTYIWRN